MRGEELNFSSDLSKENYGEIFKDSENGENVKELIEICKEKDKEYPIVRNGESGYIVHNNEKETIAEAPWVVFDYDDTAVKSTEARKEMWERIENELKIKKELIELSEKISRFKIEENEREKYHPEIQMRILSILADNKIEEEQLSDLEEMPKEKIMEEYSIDEKVEQIFKETLYNPKFFQDTIGSLKTFKRSKERPLNTAILTYGDFKFQLQKIINSEIIEKGEINEIWITDKNKKEFIEDLFKSKPHKDLPLKYIYPETEPKRKGIYFESWKVPMIIFDDSRGEVTGLNEKANEMEWPILASNRVKRKGSKRYDDSLSPEMQSKEIEPEKHPDINIFGYEYTKLALNLMKKDEKRLRERFGVKILQDPYYQNLLHSIEIAENQINKEK